MNKNKNERVIDDFSPEEIRDQREQYNYAEEYRADMKFSKTEEDEYNDNFEANEGREHDVTGYNHAQTRNNKMNYSKTKRNNDVWNIIDSQ